MKKTLLISIFSLGAFLINAQTVLWEITGRRLESPSYLYGTIHIQDKRVFAFGDEVMAAFNASDAYAMELLLDEVDPVEMQKSMLMENNSLDKLLSKEDYEFLDSIMKAKTGQGVMLMNKMKPFFLSSQLMQMDLAKDQELALDMYLLEKAKEDGKKVFGIEEYSDQIGAIDAISLEDQAKMLIDGLRDTAQSSGNEMEGLIDSYLKGDLDKMYELSKDTVMPAEFYQAFLVDRNVKMAKNISLLIREQTTFNAIGAAHLPGENGVIELLRKRGFTVKPIIFEWKTVAIEEEKEQVKD